MSGILERKTSHLDLCVAEDVEHRGGTLLDEVQLLHDALPELALEEVELATTLFGRRLAAPLFVSGMTGGTPAAAAVNRALAAVAQKCGLGMGVGSQRAMLERPETAATYRLRAVAPDIVVLANLGAVQARDGGAVRVRELVDAIEADALCIHLNVAQELVQAEGDRDFRGCLDAIATLAATLPVPVVAKETGCGLSPGVLERLRAAGVAWVDVSGAGGTSWTGVEALRGPARQRGLGEELREWGIPTAASIVYAHRAGLGTIASGGIRSGLDAARALALGADAVALALPFLRAYAAGGIDGALETAERLVTALRAVLLLTGSRRVTELRRARRILGPRLRAWID
ncbi:MAG TPA: type 2 isopentenyl-diphosphate Delta-isomerase [Myxococcota bacterium]|nr:type 2 isopentenyl-diphosphate Delta-isomerase [Myxococcota bacterium]